MGRESKFLVCLMLLLMLSFSSSCETSALSSTAQNSVFNPAATSSETGEAMQFAPNPPNPEILYLSNVTTLQSTAKQVAELVDVTIIQTVTSSLSGFDNRYTGTQGCMGAISYIQEFLRLNCSINKVYLDNFTFNDRGALIQASNIVAKLDAPNSTSKTLLVTAHHDSIGYQYPLNVYSTGAKGADDDASGLGAVLETARILSMIRQCLRYNVVFIIFAAEEGNKTTDPAFMRQGSTHWISGNHVGADSLHDIISVVNLDVVAYKYGGPIGVYHHISGDIVAVNITSAASMLGIPAQDEGHARADSYLKPVRCRTEDAFDNAGIPAVTLSTHYANSLTHTTQDTLLNLDFGKALNFTKAVVSYVYLTSGVILENQKTYTADWVSAICSKGQYTIDEVNYIDVLTRPSFVVGYKLIVLDPFLGGMSPSSLLSIASACIVTGRRLPVLTLGRVGTDLLDILTQGDIESTDQYSSNNDLVAYVTSSLTELSHHPVFSFPNKIVFTYENATTSSYKVGMGQANISGQCRWHLVRNTNEANTSFLQLSYTPYAHELWSWLGVLHTHNSSCGPIGFIGADNASTLTAAAQNIAENMVYWLLNGPKTAIIVEPSESSPLVGDHVKINVVLRDSLTWKANSSIPISLIVRSPSSNLILRETEVTDQNGVAESSRIFLTEIGEYRVNVTTLASGGMDAIGTITPFMTCPRVNVHYTSEVSVTQGESTNIQLNLTYIPTMPETMILTLGGRPLPSNLSIGVDFNHGYNNINLTIPTREAVRAGEYNLTLTIMPTTKEYFACQQFIGILITPGYGVNIIEAPETMAQGSGSRLVLQVTSHRTVAVNVILRIESTGIMVSGEAPFILSAGETRQITLQVEEASISPYCWGQGEMKISLIRNDFPVVESRPLPIYVSISPANLFLGYILPPALLVAILIDRLRKTKVKQAGIGTLLGGSLLFACGLMISQSMLMVVPLAMLVAGSYLGTAAVQYIYDKPLPKGYDWLTPSEVAEDKDEGSRRADSRRRKQG